MPQTRHEARQRTQPRSAYFCSQSRRCSQERDPDGAEFLERAVPARRWVEESLRTRAQRGEEASVEEEHDWWSLRESCAAGVLSSLIFLTKRKELVGAGGSGARSDTTKTGKGGAEGLVQSTSTLSAVPDRNEDSYSAVRLEMRWMRSRPFVIRDGSREDTTRCRCAPVRGGNAHTPWSGQQVEKPDFLPN
ncbi:hypothetical protein B0H15DRAFT_872552 [Mycena belliarum]|uniref:Uncharacterized protein n=1 Tax=Mycena belliarum TaxID=1033014 RepID=A0AAD6XFN5_9AGAR|nr:hypothetical protein B0H15DRAFT_872552 [Mycena belliae]